MAGTRAQPALLVPDPAPPAKCEVLRKAHRASGSLTHAIAFRFSK
jgi:hypothetical protein